MYQPYNPCYPSGFLPQLHQSPNRSVLLAVLEEMKFWNQIMAEHAMLMRNSFDLTEEDFFRASDSFAVHLGALMKEVQGTPEHAPDEVIGKLVEKSLLLVSQLRDFKIFVYERLERCQTLSVLPSLLIDHIRREADFYLSILHRSRGQGTATHEAVGIPDGGRRLQSMPIELIPTRPREEQIQIALEETLFWSRIHMEHALHLSMSFTTIGQERYIAGAQQFQRHFHDHILYAQAVEQEDGDIRKLNTDTIALSCSWRDYLIRTHDDLKSCRIPHKHANFPPALADHMRRETDYLIGSISQVRI